MKFPGDILREAAALLTDKAWIKGLMSKTKSGEEVYPDSPDACRWCADGALRKVTGEDEHVNYEIAAGKVRQIIEGMGFESIEDWNDAPGRTAADVRAVLLKAAALWDRE